MAYPYNQNYPPQGQPSYPPQPGMPTPQTPGGGGEIGFGSLGQQPPGQPQYGGQPGGYGAPAYGAQPGAQPGGYGAPAYGAQPGAYGAPPPTQPGAYGAPAYGAPPPTQPGAYGAPPVAQPGAYGAPPVAQPGAYGAPPVAQPGAYGAPPGGQPGAYGAPPGGQPAPQPGYGASQSPGYGSPQPNYGQPQGAHQQPPPQGYQQQQQPPQGYQQQQQHQQPPPQQQQHQQPPPQQQQQSPPAQAPAHQAAPAPASASAPPAPVDNVTAAMASMSMKAGLGGTIKPDPNFDAEAEAEKLRKAMKGMGTNEKALIDVLGTHTMREREQIAKMFKTMYGKDLAKDMKSETSFNFQQLLLKLVQGVAVFDGMELRAAMKGAGTNEKAVIEILCSRTNAEIEGMKSYFKIDLHRDLEKDIISETSGHFKRLLVSMVTANRDESTTVDDEKAKKEAEMLYSAGEKKLGTDESKFNQILALRNFAQLNRMYAHYAKISGYDIERSIEHEMSGDLKKGFLCVVQCSRNPATYFANELWKSLKGMGTDDSSLIRIVVSRAEKDLEDIKAEFLKLHKKTLKKMIEDDCSGHYKNLLIKIVGN